ncbi:MAG: serine--tRNA ligase [Chloroflexi bacterium]|nr:serine--tRNA ligase [Chloroflexota bacterium]
MLDLELIRRDPDLVRQALKRRGEEVAIEPILEMDARRRQAVHEGDDLRERRNEVSKLIGQLLGEAKQTENRKQAEELSERTETSKEEMRQVGERIKELENQVKSIGEGLDRLLLTLPNIARDDVPDGPDETANVILRSWGEPRSFDFTPIAHWDLGERLGIIDFQRGAKLSGSRFYVLMGAGARLQRALIGWMLDLHTSDHGYVEVYPPAMVLEEVMRGSGNLPKFRDNLYHDAEEDLWLIPSAEVPLTGLHREEILDPGMLPLSYVAYTPCFRREKTAAGRDTRGIKRVHQFDKVELYKYTEPEHSDEELQRLLGNAEEVIRRLDIPYRVVQLCTGDLGFQSAKSYDLEMWAPGSGEWLEVSSCSNCSDFQARRSNIRFRREPRGRTEFVHTLNGSGLAIPRVMISILENYQQEDGSVMVPEVLRSYMGTGAMSPK